MSSNGVYYRRTTPKMTLKLWQILDELNGNPNETQFRETLFTQLNDSMDSTIDTIVCNQVIDNAIEDKLIVVEDTNGCDKRVKPSFNRSLFGELTNDWFCFECHSCDANDCLIDCKSCFRAFHMQCIEQSFNSMTYFCKYCLKSDRMDNTLRIYRMDKNQLNESFGVVMENLENSIPGFDVYSEYSLGVNQKSNVLIYKYLDLKTIKEKIISQMYENVDEFENDFKHFVHNFKVYRIDGLHQYFDIYITNEINHLKSCVDCYNYAFNKKYHNSSDPLEFFTFVCEPQHEVVYAKYHCNPFWPSKVINISEDGTKYEVQFFEPPAFLRSTVSQEMIKPIDYKFERKKFNNELFKQSLILVAKHLKQLIARGFNPQNQYTRALHLFAKYEIIDQIVFEEKTKKSVKRKKNDVKDENTITDSFANLNITSNTTNHTSVPLNTGLKKKEKKKISKKKEFLKMSSNNSMTPTDSVANDRAGTSGQPTSGGSTKTTTITKTSVNQLNSDESDDELSDNEMKSFSEFLKSDEFPNEMKFEICSLIIRNNQNKYFS